MLKPRRLNTNVMLICGLMLFQTGRAADAPVLTGTSTAAELTEIVVTANKREESISSVPMSITAVNAQSLKQLNINSVGDLSHIVPALNVTSASYGTDVYTIRGVGFYDTTLAAVPAVSVYVDEVPLPFSVMTTAASLDPERVEVLLGPQGTIFGQNSTGGAINYIAAKPTNAFAAGVTATGGNYATYNGDAYVSGPLSNTVNARLSVRSLNSNDGWQHSVTRDDTLGKVHQQEARLLLDWKASDRLSFRVNVNGFEDKSDTQAQRYLGYALNIPSLAFAVPQLTGAQPTTGPAQNADWAPDGSYPLKKDDKFYQLSLRGEFQATDNLKLTSITAYSDYSHDQGVDLNGLDIQNLDYRILGGIRDIYEELRMSGNWLDAGRFVVGGSYQHDTVNQYQLGNVDIYTTSFAPVYLAGLPRFHNFEDISYQRVESYAGFANFDYDVNPLVILHAGVRYTDTTTKLQGCSVGDASLNAIAGSTNPPGQCLTLSPAFVSGYVYNTLAQNNVSWRIGTDFKITADTLIYANVSRGFKAGSFPVLAASDSIQLNPVRQEELTAYELGVKSALLNHTLRLTAAAFHYDYVDKQIRGRVQEPVFGLLETLVNVPKSTVNGAEMHAEWLPTAGLHLDAGFSYIYSDIKNFSNYDVEGNIVSLDGAKFPNAPAFRGNVSARYDHAVNDALFGFVGTDYGYSSATRGTLGFTPQLNIPSYGLLGIQAGVHTVDDRWRIALWAKNLTNKFYLDGANRGGETLIAEAGKPRTYGLSASYYYGAH